MEQRQKYLGNSFDCSFPNVCRGRFLYIVIPATNVVYTTVPNHVPNDKTLTIPAALVEILVSGDWVE